MPPIILHTYNNVQCIWLLTKYLFKSNSGVEAKTARPQNRSPGLAMHKVWGSEVV